MQLLGIISSLRGKASYVSNRLIDGWQSTLPAVQLTLQGGGRRPATRHCTRAKTASSSPSAPTAMLDLIDNSHFAESLSEVLPGAASVENAAHRCRDLNVWCRSAWNRPAALLWTPGRAIRSRSKCGSGNSRDRCNYSGRIADVGYSFAHWCPADTPATRPKRSSRSSSASPPASGSGSSALPPKPRPDASVAGSDRHAGAPGPARRRAAFSGSGAATRNGGGGPPPSP